LGLFAPSSFLPPSSFFFFFFHTTRVSVPSFSRGRPAPKRIFCCPPPFSPPPIFFYAFFLPKVSLLIPRALLLPLSTTNGECLPRGLFFSRIMMPLVSFDITTFPCWPYPLFLIVLRLEWEALSDAPPPPFQSEMKPPVCYLSPSRMMVGPQHPFSTFSWLPFSYSSHKRSDLVQSSPPFRRVALRLSGLLPLSLHTLFFLF